MSHLLSCEGYFYKVCIIMFNRFQRNDHSAYEQLNLLIRFRIDVLWKADFQKTALCLFDIGFNSRQRHDGVHCPEGNSGSAGTYKILSVIGKICMSRHFKASNAAAGLMNHHLDHSYRLIASTVNFVYG